MAAERAHDETRQRPPSRDEEERRAEVRYVPDPLVPVLFGHPGVEVPSAGHIVDISESGVRIIAPPMARPGLHWGDPLRIIVSWSASSRDSEIEGLSLRAHVVRVVADQRAYTLQARFDKAGSDGDWTRLSEWVRQLATHS